MNGRTANADYYCSMRLPYEKAKAHVERGKIVEYLLSVIPCRLEVRRSDSSFDLDSVPKELLTTWHKL